MLQIEVGKPQKCFGIGRFSNRKVAGKEPRSAAAALFSDSPRKEASALKPDTKQTIQASFRTLLMAKSLDKITVRDIVEDCGLTRNTFYYHYEDIYDLFDDYLDVQLREVNAALPADSSWDAALQKLLNCVCQTPQMGRHIFFSRKHDAMRQYLSKVLNSVLDRYIDEEMRGLVITVDDRRMVCDTCCHALYGLIEQWLTGPDALLLQVRLRRVTRSFEGAVRAALEYCATHPMRKEDLT